MFDDLREDAASGYEAEPKPIQELAGPGPTFSPKPRSRRILGMTAQQRFVISFMFMIAVCVIGIMALFVTGKIGF